MFLRTLSPLLLLAAAVSAQTGPFQDGELLIYNPNGNDPQLLRVDPSTGQAAVLHHDNFTWGGWADSMVYDPYRGAVVASMSFPPDPYWKERPWVLGSDGSAVAIPGIEDEVLNGMEAIGDGRIYFQRNVLGNAAIEYFDASNQIHVLMDETGLAPVSLEIEHMVYDPVGNALIASANPWWTGVNCTASDQNALYRLPLSPDGSQLAAPISCTSLVAGSLICMGLSRMPDGNIMAVFAGTTQFGFLYPEKFWSVDPTTLSASLWSESTLADLNGGLYSSRLNKVLVFEDGTNTLRSYGFGQDDNGTILNVSLPIGDGTTGYSPADTMVQLDVFGPDCLGYAANHGVGLAGSGGLVPTLGAVGCPDLGLSWSLAMGQVVGGAFGILFAGTAVTALPFKGGTFYVDGLALGLSFFVGGASGVAGAGDLNVPLVLSEPGLSGFEIVLQAGFQDPGALFGVSLSPALRVKGW